MLVCALALLFTVGALIVAVYLIRDLHQELSNLRRGPRVTHYPGLKIRERL
jgi:hypothetical protein